MHTPRLFEKILERVGATPEIRAEKAKARMTELNRKLEAQLKSQKMTPEVLAKRCTL